MYHQYNKAVSHTTKQYAEINENELHWSENFEFRYTGINWMSQVKQRLPLKLIANMNMAIIYNNYKYYIEESIFLKIKCFLKEIVVISTLLVYLKPFRWVEEGDSSMGAESCQSRRTGHSWRKSFIGKTACSGRSYWIDKDLWGKNGNH